VFSFKLPSVVIKDLERMFSNFLWNNKMHARTWKDICIPKREEGMGIRRLTDLNKASGVRLVWRLCTSQSLWSKWISTHYLKSAHISQCSATPYDSGTWKWLCSLKDLVLSNMKISLGNGDNTFLFYDNRLPGNVVNLAAQINSAQIPA